MPRFLLLVLSLVPVPSLASVIVSEVAWMGSVDSANHEWIELYNPGNQVNLTGWQVTDGANLTIPLGGTLASGAVVVLERTSDDSAPGAAFLTYTGALTNSGATLVLTDATGTEIDRVTGGSGWAAIGGDNDSKATAQRTDTGWTTAAATPGTVPTLTTTQPTTDASTDDSQTTAVETTSNKTNDTPVQARGSGSTADMRLTLPGVTLELAVDAPELVHVNQPVTFSVTPSGIGDTLLESLSYEWNFGDGSTGSGQTPTHTYHHPGRYVVVVTGEYKRQRQVARVEVVVRPATLELSQSDKGDVTITNAGDHEVDLAHHRLVGHDTFTFPPYSILLPGQSITIASDRLGARQAAMVALYDQTDQATAMVVPDVSYPVVAVQPPSSPARPAPAPRISALSYRPPVIDQSPPTTNERFTFANDSSETILTPPSPPVAALAAAELPGSAATPNREEQPPVNWPLYTFAGLLILAILALLLVPRREGE